MAPASNDPPGAIAPPPGCFPQPQVRHQILRGARCDVEFFRNHPGRDDRPAHHIVDEGGQPGGGAAAGELARQQGAGGGPALVLLEPGFAGRREGVDEGDEAGGLVHRPAALPRHGAEPDGEADEMGFDLAARAEQRRDQQTPEPGTMLQRRNLLPGVEREGGGEIGGRAAVCPTTARQSARRSSSFQSTS